VQQLQKALATVHADLLHYISAVEPVLNLHSPDYTLPAYSKVHMIHAAASEQQQENLMEFPNSREELQLNKEQLIELAFRMGGSWMLAWLR